MKLFPCFIEKPSEESLQGVYAPWSEFDFWADFGSELDRRGQTSLILTKAREESSANKIKQEISPAGFFLALHVQG